MVTSEARRLRSPRGLDARASSRLADFPTPICPGRRRLGWLLCGLCAVLLLASRPSHAQLIAYEGFEEYAAGTQVESGANGVGGPGINGGAGWSGAYDVNNGIKSLVFVEDRTASPVVYQNGEVRLDGGLRALRMNGNANASYALKRALATTVPADGVLYFSVLFRTNNSSPLANQDFVQLGFDDNANASNGAPRMSIGTNTISTTFPPNQPYRFFARCTTTPASNAFDDSADIRHSCAEE